MRDVDLSEIQMLEDSARNWLCAAGLDPEECVPVGLARGATRLRSLTTWACSLRQAVYVAEARVKELEAQLRIAMDGLKATADHRAHVEAEVAYEQERNRNNVLQYSQENERLREAIKEYLDVIDNAPDESSTSELREIVSQPPEPMQPCGHPESDRVSLTRCKHGCIYGCLLPSHDHLT